MSASDIFKKYRKPAFVQSEEELAQLPPDPEVEEDAEVDALAQAMEQEHVARSIADPIKPNPIEEEPAAEEAPAPGGMGSALSSALMALVPAVIGYAVGGKRGGAYGAKAGKEGLEKYDQSVAYQDQVKRDQDKQERDLQSRKDLASSKAQSDTDRAELDNEEKMKRARLNALALSGDKAAQRQLQKELKELDIASREKMAAKKAGKGGGKGGKGGGKQLSPTIIKQLSAGKHLPKLLEGVKTTLEANKDAFGPVKNYGPFGKNPYNERQATINAQLKTATQAVGKYLESGVLRKEDEEKYREMLPKLDDVGPVAFNKLQLVVKLLVEQHNTDIQSLVDGGYDADFMKIDGEAIPLPDVLTKGGKAAPKSAAPPAELPDAEGRMKSAPGYRYIGKSRERADLANPKNWVKE